MIRNRPFLIVLTILTVVSIVGLVVTPAEAAIGPGDPGTSDQKDPARYLPPTGPIHWMLSDAEAVEGDSGNPGVLRFEVTASHAPLQNMAFWATTTSSFAKSGEDFVGFEEMLVVFPAGETSITIEVPLIGDVWIEDDEDMVLYVWRPVATGGYTVLMGIGQILDDDDLWRGLPPIEIPKAGPRWF